eukprot:73393_1
MDKCIGIKESTTKLALNTNFEPTQFSSSIFEPGDRCLGFVRSLKYYFNDLKFVLNDKTSMKILLQQLAICYLSEYPYFNQHILYSCSIYNRYNSLCNMYTFYGYYQQNALSHALNQYLPQIDCSFIGCIISEYIVSKHQTKQINSLVKCYETIIELNQNYHDKVEINHHKTITLKTFCETIDLKALNRLQKKK